MLDKKKKLGRGLGALLGDDDVNFENFAHIEQATTKEASLLKISDIAPCRFQPRTEFDKDALEALAKSISRNGILQPLLVRKTLDGYELVAGERRLRAAQMAGLKEVPIIEKSFSDQDTLEVALVENLMRENLSAIEEAEGFQRLSDEFAYSHENIGLLFSKSRSHVTNALRLLTLPENIKNLIRENKLSAGHARQLIGLDNAEELANKIIENDLSVRAVEILVAKQKAPKPVKEKKIKSEDISQIEKDLNKSLGLRIKISQSKQGGGKVVLKYASVAELDMIIDILEQRKQPMNTVFKPEAVINNNEKFTMKVVG